MVLVLIFSVNLGWLPSSGAYDIGKADDLLNRIQHMILPLTVMILSHLWYYAYMIRNKMLDEIRKEYVLLAKSKGCKKSEIILKHCFRNVAPTIVSIMAISIPHVLSGTFIAEAVFNYPGIGALSVTRRQISRLQFTDADCSDYRGNGESSSIIAQFINEGLIHE